MASILAIETATQVCSVALAIDGTCVYNQIVCDNPSHAATAPLFAEKALTKLNAAGRELDAVAVSCGPGSYTGLRIGVSLAKGLCFGREAKLISIPTLDILTSIAIAKDTQRTPHTRYLPMIDARRMEVYAAIYDGQMNVVRKIAADIIDEESYTDYLQQGRLCFFGNGAEKCRKCLTSPNACFIDEIVPTAEAMLPLAEKRYQAGQFENVAYFEPFYLKDYQATIAKNKVLGR